MRSDASSQPRGRTASVPPGVTVTELIAVIVILAMVLAIILPVLSSVQSRARGVVGEANLRTHAQVLSMYAGDNAGWMPYFGEPGPDPIGYEFENEAFFPVMFFDTHRFWHLWLSDEYYDQSSLADVFRAPWQAGETEIDSAYLYPCVYLASPAYWRAETRMFGDSQLRGTRLDQVRLPSQKSLVVLPPPNVPSADSAGRRISFAKADGSVAGVSLMMASRGYPRGDGASHQKWGAVHPIDTPPMMHTIGGVHGVDVAR